MPPPPLPPPRRRVLAAPTAFAEAARTDRRADDARATTAAAVPVPPVGMKTMTTTRTETASGWCAPMEARRTTRTRPWPPRTRGTCRCTLARATWPSRGSSRGGQPAPQEHGAAAVHGHPRAILDAMALGADGHHHDQDQDRDRPRPGSGPRRQARSVPSPFRKPVVSVDAVGHDQGRRRSS